MKFDDEKLYDEDAQSFGPFAVRNYKEVLQSYNYRRYEKRFRALADSQKLSTRQRPKLDQSQFAALMKELADRLLTSRDPDPLDDPKSQQAAFRLLLANDFEEDEDGR